ncbi:hypothetical protein RUND412_004780 [Rhizina undulata]
MAARNRPRALVKDEQDAAHEERDLWSKIANGLKELGKLSRRAADIATEINLEEERLADSEPSLRELEALKKLYAEQFKLSENEAKELHNLSEMDDLLIALRTATEGGDRGVEKKRTKRKLDEAIAADSPTNRNIKVARSMSAAPTDALQLNSEVAYRLPKQKNAEGEWIQCIITNIIGEGNKRRYFDLTISDCNRLPHFLSFLLHCADGNTNACLPIRYEVQDPEPDDVGGHGTTYRASAGALIPIPKDSAGLVPYPVGKQVLARYPETTTFYRAEVMGTKRDGTCRLKFEGEEEVGKETEVERRLVLDVGNK